MSERDDLIEQAYQTPSGLCGVRGCVFLRNHPAGHSWEVPK